MIVIDTHVLVWLIEGDEKLGAMARQKIEAERDESCVLVCAISVWEIAMLTRRGRLALSLAPEPWIDLMLATPGFDLVPLEPAIALRAAGFDWVHRDPADRFITATAMELDVPVMTADGAILDYAVAGHLQAIDARR